MATKGWHELRTRGEHLSDSTIEDGLLMIRESEEYPEVNDDSRSPEEQAMHPESFLYSDVDGITKRKRPLNVGKEVKQLEKGKIAGYSGLRNLVNAAQQGHKVSEGSLLSYMVDEKDIRPERGGLTR